MHTSGGWDRLMTLANASASGLGGIGRTGPTGAPVEAGLWFRAVETIKERRRRRYLAAVKRRLRRFDPPTGR